MRGASRSQARSNSSPVSVRAKPTDGDGAHGLPRIADAREDNRRIDGASGVRRIPQSARVIREDASAARRLAA